MENKEKKNFKYAAAALVFWIAVWQFASYRVGMDLVIPSPVSVIREFVKLVEDPSFWQASGVSFLRIATGFAAGSVLGVVIGIITCFVRPFDVLVSPAMRLIRSTPVASFIILVLLWLKKTNVPAFIAMLMVMPVLWQATYTGLESTDKMLIEMADMYHVPFRKKFFRIYMPGALNNISAGLLTASGLAWKSGIAAEVLCLPSKAIGTNLYYSKIYLETPSLFAWTITVIILSFVIDFCMKKILSYLLRRKKNAENG